jgi:hypothetical protein
MQYIYYATTPPNTPASNPLHTVCPLTFGYLTSVLFVIPKGCAGLVGIQLYQQSALFFPNNPSNWFTGDDLAQDFIEEVNLTQGLVNIDLVTYNLDTLYPHTIEVVFTITPPVVPSSGGQGGSSGETNDISSLPSPEPEPTPSPQPTPTPTPTPETPTPIVITVVPTSSQALLIGENIIFW